MSNRRSPASSSLTPPLVMVLKGWPRVSESFISNEIGLIEAAGANVRLCSMRPPREAVRHGSVQAIRAPVLYLPETLLSGAVRFAAGFVRLALRAPKRLGKGLAALRARLPESASRLATVRHFLQAILIAHDVLDLGPEAAGQAWIHAHFAHSPTSVAWFVAAILERPFSVTAHAKDVWTQDPAALTRKLKAAAFFLTCTALNREYLKSLAPEADVRLSYHGIDLDFFTPPARSSEAVPPYRVLTVARLTDKKGLDTILRAIARLASNGLDLTWRLVGEGEDRAQLVRLAEELGVRGRVEFLGTRTHEEVVRELESADAFALGSRVSGNGDRDGVPNVLVEALAMRLPVVATAVSAIPELVRDGVDGLLVPPNNADAFAAALGRALTDEQARVRFMDSGRARVEALFDNRRNVAEVIRTFADHAPRLFPPQPALSASSAPSASSVSSAKR